MPSTTSRIDTAFFKKCLEQKLKEIRGNRAVDATVLSDLNTRVGDSADQSTRIHEEWITLTRNQIDTLLVRLIREALTHLENGTYGTCQDCNADIPLRRLEAVPWTKFCVHCQDAQE